MNNELGNRIDVDTTSPLEPESNIPSVARYGSMFGLGAGGAVLGTKLGSKAGYYMGDDYGGGKIPGGIIGGALGGATGIAALPVGAAIGKSAINRIKNIEMDQVASAAKTSASRLAQSGKAGAQAIGSALGSAGKFGLQAVSGVNSETVLGSAMSPIRTGIGAINKIAKGAFIVPDKIKTIEDMSKIKMTGFISGAQKAWAETSGGKMRKAIGAARGSIMSGQSLLFAGATAKGIKSGIDAAHNINQGTRMQGVYTNTPGLPEYDDNSGATGDLVFALHRLRGGAR